MFSFSKRFTTAIPKKERKAKYRKSDADITALSDLYFKKARIAANEKAIKVITAINNKLFIFSSPPSLMDVYLGKG